MDVKTLHPRKDWYKGGWFIYARHDDGEPYKWSDERYMTRREALERIRRENDGR